MSSPDERPSPKRRRAAANQARRESVPSAGLNAVEFASIRDLFWHNVVSEMLAGLTAVAEKRPDLMDGRFAVLTRGGERIPISRVEPVFAYTVRGTAAERRASAAVQMTVYRVTTPQGEVFTLPVQEVRGFHELTQELLARLQQVEDEQSRAEGEDPPRPFGFAAFQALPKSGPGLPGPAPTDPLE